MTEIEIIKEPIALAELKRMAKEMFGDFVKAVIDVEQGIMAVGGALHADEEVVLSEQENSSREHTWGINIYPERSGDEMIEFDSMVNLKPALGNRTRDVEDPKIRQKIAEIIGKLISE